MLRVWALELCCHRNKRMGNHTQLSMQVVLSILPRRIIVLQISRLAVMWSITHFHSYLYGGTVTVITDHSAVKSVLKASNPHGRHACWWTRVYGRGIKSLTIVYHAGRKNASADALSMNPLSPPPAQSIGQGETQVSAVTASDSLRSQQEITPTSQDNLSYSAEQLIDSSLKEMMVYLEQDALPDDKRSQLLKVHSLHSSMDFSTMWTTDALTKEEQSSHNS